MTQPCPRQTNEATMPMQREHVSHWLDDGTCSYCGSLNPDILITRLEDGTATLGATDKGYKAYIHNHGGAPFLQTYRDCPRDKKCTGPDDCTHWVTRETSQAKFYFQHFNEAQMIRFIEMYNAGSLMFEDYGRRDDGTMGTIIVNRGFYRMPYFMKAA